MYEASQKLSRKTSRPLRRSSDAAPKWTAEQKRTKNLMKTLYDSTEVVTGTRDITGNEVLMPGAQRMVAAAYHALSPTDRGISADGVYEMICHDAYQQPSRSHTIAMISGGCDDGQARISGLVRVVFGAANASDGLMPIDAMNFVVPLEQWPHERPELGDQMIAELGRFVINKDFRTTEMRAAEVPHQITRSLVEGALAVIRPLGIQFLYAIMPTYASRLLIQSGIKLEELPCRLRTEDEAASRTFEDFSIYWKRSSPRLYRFLSI